MKIEFHASPASRLGTEGIFLQKGLIRCGSRYTILADKEREYAW